jgi:CelD/BcsL family acetyltransferase involved in cellulose biosynthesis
MSSSDPQKAEFLADSKNIQFFQQITAVLHQKGWVQLSFLTMNGERVATYLNFDYLGHILVYNSGLMPSHGDLSPGIVLLAYNIRHAIETGHKIYDFLQGNEAYKYRMGAVDTGVVNLIADYGE